MPTLDASQTRRRIRDFGIEKAKEASFALHECERNLAYDWHAHSRHQMIYSISGRVILESKEARWLLPPQRAAWIPARLRHRTTLDNSDAVSVYFQRVPAGLRVHDIRILRANPLLREMLIYAAREWPVKSQGSSLSRRAFFAALALLCQDWIEHELPFRLSTPSDPQVKKAVAYLLAHLDTTDIEQTAQASGQSARTLRRRFRPATGMTWREYRRHAAMLRAMELLLNSRKSILEIALAVGYDSPSAFSKAFAEFTGALPLIFRRSNCLNPAHL
jgi:AraC-like DNA-binding protein/quercetin dioxygenase-like cupin family protein